MNPNSFPLNCLKCGQKMTEGYVLELGHRGSVFPTIWIKDPPIRWKGTSWVDLRGKPKYYIASHRCEGCGFLESYARTPVPNTGVKHINPTTRLHIEMLIGSLIGIVIAQYWLVPYLVTAAHHYTHH